MHECGARRACGILLIEPTNSLAFASDRSAAAFELTGSLAAGGVLLPWWLIATGLAIRSRARTATPVGR